MFPQLFHWLFHDAAIWVRETAQLHPYWCFPIGFAIAFCFILWMKEQPLRSAARHAAEAVVAD